MTKQKKDPFVQLVADLHKFSPQERARALALVNMTSAMNANVDAPAFAIPAQPKEKPAAPKPKDNKVSIQRIMVAPPKKGKRRGRKPGSKNKPKAPVGGLTPPSTDPVAQSFHSAAESFS